MGIKGLTFWVNRQKGLTFQLQCRSTQTSSAEEETTRLSEKSSSRNQVIITQRKKKIHIKTHPIFRNGFGRWTDQGRLILIDLNPLLYALLFGREMSIWWDFQKMAEKFTAFMRCLLLCGLDIALMSDGVHSWLANGKQTETIRRKRDRQRTMIYNHNIMMDFHSQLRRDQSVSCSSSAERRECAIGGKSSTKGGRFKRPGDDRTHAQRAQRNLKTEQLYAGIPIHELIQHCVNELCIEFDDCSRVKFIQCTQECDTGIFQYARTATVPLFGIITNDSDFYFWDLPCPVIQVDSIHFDRNHSRNWGCSFVMSHSVWSRLFKVERSKEVSLGLRLCFVRAKGNDCTVSVEKIVERARDRALRSFAKYDSFSDTGTIEEEESKRETEEEYDRDTDDDTGDLLIYRVNSEWISDHLSADLLDYLGKHLVDFYLPKPISPVVSGGNADFLIFGTLLGSLMPEDFSIDNPEKNGLSQMLNATRKALYLRPSFQSVIESKFDGKVHELIFEHPRLRSDPSVPATYVDTLVDLRLLRQNNPGFKPLAIPSRQKELESVIDNGQKTDSLVHQMSDLSITEHHSVGSKSITADSLTSQIWNFGRDRRELISKVRVFLEEALSEMNRLMPGLEDLFSVQMKALRIQYFWRNYSGKQGWPKAVDKASLDKSKEWMKINRMPHPRDIHFQSLFMRFCTLFCFDFMMPPSQILFSGPHYHCVCSLFRDPNTYPAVLNKLDRVCEVWFNSIAGRNAGDRPHSKSWRRRKKSKKNRSKGVAQ